MICAAAVFVAPLARAQDAPAPTPTPSPARTPSVFTLPGVVPERYSLPGATPVPVPSVPTVTPVATPTPTAVAQPSRAPARRVEQRPAAAPEPRAAAPTPAPSPAITPMPAIPTPAPTVAAAPPIAISQPAPRMPGWLWMLIGAAATAALGGLAWLLLRRRDDPVFEEVPDEPLPAPPPAPVATPPAPTPPPASVTPPPAPAPRSDPFEIAIQPSRIELGERDVVLDFELLIGNRQAEPAEAIRLTLAMMSASAEQDRILAGFHRGPPGEAGEPFDLQSGSGVRMPARLMLAREQVQVVQIGGRPMFVVMVLIDLRWRGGLSIRRFGADFMVGRAGQGDRIGPIWLDRGPSTGPLGATRYFPREAAAA